MTKLHVCVLIGVAHVVACNASPPDGATDSAAAARLASATASVATVESAAPSTTASSAPATSTAPEGMVFIAGATFEAVEGDQTKKQTTVAAFFIDRKKVTDADYKRCFEEKACRPKHNPLDFLDPASGPGPVTHRSQDEAAEYCRHVGKRLPTAAEWQLAARGQEGRIYPWGSEPPVPCHAPACKPLRQATPEGVIGMAGHLWEFSDDTACYTGGSKKGCANLASVIHGGAWNTSADSFRSLEVHNAASVPMSTIGFRCATNAPRSR